MKALKRLHVLATEIPRTYSGENILLSAGGESAVVRQSSAQLLFCKRSDRLPQVIYNGTWEQLEKFWRVTRGPQLEGVFYAVTLPEKWKLYPGSHSYWSELLDHRGALRAYIFFRINGRECRACSILTCRYVTKRESTAVPGAQRHLFRSRIVDMANGNTIFKTEWRNNFDDAFNLPLEFLNENYPEHRKPFAYWPD